MESQSCPSLQEESKAKANTTEEESRVTTAARLLAGFADQGRRHEPRNAAPEARKDLETDSARGLQKGDQL